MSEARIILYGGKDTFELEVKKNIAFLAEFKAAVLLQSRFWDRQRVRWRVGIGYLEVAKKIAGIEGNVNIDADFDLLAFLEGQLVLSGFQRWLRDLLRWHIQTVHEGRTAIFPNKDDYDIVYADEET
mgnify:FL=1